MTEVIDLVSPETRIPSTNDNATVAKDLPAKTLDYNAPIATSFNDLIDSSYDWDMTHIPSSDPPVPLPTKEPLNAIADSVLTKRPSRENTMQRTVSRASAGTVGAKDTYRAKNTGSITNGGGKMEIPASMIVTIIDSTDDEKEKEDVFASSPPPFKRRRVSESPKPGPVKRVASAGYQRSKSNVESSTRTARTSTGSGRIPPGAVKKATSANNRGTMSNIESSARVAGSSRDVNALPTLSKSKSKTIEDDIVYTSSIEAAKNRKVKPKPKQTVISSDDLPDVGQIAGYREKEKEKDEWHELSSDNDLAVKKPKKKPKASAFGGDDSLGASSEVEEPVSKKNKTKRTKEEIEADREKVKEKTAADKVRKAEAKKLEKEQKAILKEKDAAIAKANTRRVDKKVSVKEMIVDIPSCLELKAKAQLQALLELRETEYTMKESSQSILKWRRKVDREFNEEKNRWDAVTRKIRPEYFALCFLSAAEFVELATGDEGADLDAHVLKLKTAHDSCQIIYHIQGYQVWKSKNNNNLNRQHEAAVNSHRQLDKPPSAASQKRKKKEQQYIDPNILEDALLNLQVVHKVFIVHTRDHQHSAESIATLTEQISLRPEKLQSRNIDTTFCMESGQVKTGVDAADTFVKMLQEMNRITHPIAYGIAAEYPSVSRLVEAFEEHGPLVLAECRKSANGNGAFSAARVGPAISKRVYNVFMKSDEGCVDV